TATALSCEGRDGGHAPGGIALMAQERPRACSMRGRPVQSQSTLRRSSPRERQLANPRETAGKNFARRSCRSRLTCVDEGQKWITLRIAEQHPRTSDCPDLIRELLAGNDEHRPPCFVEQPDSLGDCVGETCAGRDEVAGRVSLEHAELAGEPGSNRRHQLRTRARAEEHRAELLRPATALCESRYGRLQGQ